MVNIHHDRYSLKQLYGFYSFFFFYGPKLLSDKDAEQERDSRCSPEMPQ